MKQINLLMIFFLPVLLFGQKLELISPGILDLGKVPSDTIATGTIQFANTGDKPLKIDQVKTSCGCTVVNMNKYEYAPGEEGKVQVRFNTRGYSGVVRKNITILLSEGEPKSTRVVLQSRVIPKIEVEPRFVDFQRINLTDQLVKRTFLVRNNMKKPLKVNHIKLNNDNVSVTPGEFELEPGQIQHVFVEYTPRKIGRDDNIILLQINKPAPMEKRVPVFVNVLPQPGNNPQ